MRSNFRKTKKADSIENKLSQKTLPLAPSDDEQVSVIRKEFVELTGDHFSAVVLNQLLYWTQRVRDFDLLLEEESCGRPPNCKTLPRYGWIYKTANDLIEETMLGMTHPTMRKYLKLLIDRGWVDERSHPNDKWNKTTQYRVNLRKLQGDLAAIDRTLPSKYLKTFSSPEIKKSQKVRKLHSIESHLQSNENNVHSNVRNLHSYTYTEIPTENIIKEHTHRARKFFNESLVKEAQELWKTHIDQDVHLTVERKHQLSALFEKHLKNDLSQWQALCERIKSSPFLMGKGPRGWHATFDWILCEDNLLKVLEGNFDPPEALKKKASNLSDRAREDEIQSLLTLIEDPLWREWCSALNFSLDSPNSVSLRELQNIVRARFCEVEDDRLVWIESVDKKALDQIEDLRLKLLSPIQRTFPNVRNLRTRLKEKDTVALKIIKQKGKRYVE